MKKLLKIKTLAICAILMAGMVIPFTMTAQRNDGFFRGRYDNINDRDDITIGGAASTTNGLTIEGMDNEDPTQAPLGSGLLVMVAAGAGYAMMRRKRSRKGTPRVSNVMMVLMALVLMLGMTQCKKKVVPSNETNKVLMTLEATCGSGNRTVFEPEIGGTGSGTAPGFTWNTSGKEYVSVGGSIQGYLGELEADASGGNAQNRIVFSGNITAPQEGEDVYFFYLGNGSHLQANGTETSTIDLSNQPNGTTETVTNFLVAIDKGDVWQEGGVYHAYADMKVKIAIAYFNLNGFVTPTTNAAEIINLHGEALYSTATINYKEGTITGNQTGNINMGTNGEKYVALIASTNNETVLQFDSNSNHGEITFCNGIKEKKFYSDELSPLPVYGALPGLFSVSPTKMVRFSPGNLQYTRHSVDEPWSTGNWSFMEHQYDYIELNNWIGYTYIPANAIDVNYENRTVIGLFGWGCTGSKDTQHGENQDYYIPNSTGYGNDYSQEAMMANAAKYGPTGSFNLSVANHSDWGYCINNDEYSSWRTLTIDEWWYMLGMSESCRSASTVSGVANARYTRAKVNDVYGLVILPDEYTHPSDVPALTDSFINHQGGDTSFSDSNVDIITENDWSKMEAAGAVFLPAAGERDEGDVFSVQDGGYYWSCTNVGGSSAYMFNYDAGFMTKYPQMRYTGFSVRLVRDAGTSN